mgnify:CR=1 FL=1
MALSKIVALVEAGVSEAHQSEARKLNEAYVHFTHCHRPLVTLKAAVTLDGKIAAPEENYGWITSEKARAHVQQVRHAHDVILTGTPDGIVNVNPGDVVVTEIERIGALTNTLVKATP